MRPLLVLIDFQQDYLNAPGIEPAVGVLVERAGQLLRKCRELRIPIAHVRTAVSRVSDNRMPHWKQADCWRCELGTPGHGPPLPLAEWPAEPILHKAGFSGFAKTGLESLLRQCEVDTLIVAGVHLHACVRQTVIDAYQSGMNVWIAEDAVGSDDPVHAAITRRYLEARSVRFAAVEVLAEELANAGKKPAHEVHSDTVRAAVDVAVQGAAAWRATGNQQRIELLRRLMARLVEDAHTLVDLITEEIGKPVRFSRAEIERTGEMLAAIISRRAASPAQESAGRAVVRRRPHGTVAVITPFNNPVYLPLGKIAPAILHGNTVVWKPAPEASRVSRYVMTLLRAAGWPQGLVSLLEGDRRVGEGLLNDSRIDAVTITGSSAAGFSAQEACARRRIPLQAELGGNNAAIIWHDADLADAAAQVAAGAFDMTGQRCTANRRVVVHEAVREPFVQLLLAASRALPWGDPRREETRIATLVNAQRRHFVASMVERAIADCGPPILPHGQGASIHDTPAETWYPPTILCCEDRHHEIVQEETFGPVLVVQTARDWQQSIGLCNGVRQGLAAAIFTRSRDVGYRFLDEAQAGILKLNRSTADADVDAPFGGWKASGLGPPEHGIFDIEFFTRPQTVYGTPMEMPDQ